MLTASKLNHDLAEPDDYAFFGLSLGAHPREVRKAYLLMAARVHPDRGGSEEAMRTLTEKYSFVMSAAMYCTECAGEGTVASTKGFALTFIECPHCRGKGHLAYDD